MKRVVCYLFGAAMVCAAVCATETVSAQSSTTDPGITIGGVTRATRNVGEEGKFVARPSDCGKLYTDLAMGYCPEGWRLPTLGELQRLVDAGSTWTSLNGVYGRHFGSGDRAIFLPAAGMDDGF